jgi:hypothetical protein
MDVQRAGELTSYAQAAIRAGNFALRPFCRVKLVCKFSLFMAKRIGVLLSGRGSNFEALADSVAAGRIQGAEIAVVVSNRKGAPGIDKAKERKIAARVIPSKRLEREAPALEVGRRWHRPHVRHTGMFLPRLS